jgi:hypothetical protein
MKHFGAKKGDAPLRSVPFTFGVLRGDEIDVYNFTALLGKVDAGGLITALRAAESDDGGKAASAYYRTISRVIDNRDGIPYGWKPEALEKASDDDRPDVFRVPYGPHKGELMPMEEAPEYLKSEVHSSRRRWLYLMEEDEDAIVDFEDLNKIFEWIIAEASGKASAVSS